MGRLLRSTLLKRQRTLLSIESCGGRVSRSSRSAPVHQRAAPRRFKAQGPPHPEIPKTESRPPPLALDSSLLDLTRLAFFLLPDPDLVIKRSQIWACMLQIETADLHVRVCARLRVQDICHMKQMSVAGGAKENFRARAEAQLRHRQAAGLNSI